MSKSKNRIDPPRLEQVAGWSQADEAAYHAAGEVPPEEETVKTPSTGETPVPPCICQHVLGNLGAADGYRARHIDLQLSAGEQEIIARLRTGLVEGHALLVPRGDGRGKHVETANDAVRWLIQQVAGLSIAAGGS